MTIFMHAIIIVLLGAITFTVLTHSSLLIIFSRFYSNIRPGDTINVIGQFDEHGRCTINRNHNLLIVHPHILLSGTRVCHFSPLVLSTGISIV